MEIELNRKGQDYVWLVAYINSSFISTVEKDLKKFKKYKDVKVYIPTVKILRKQFKGKNEFEEVPLLFNYGFFQIRKISAHAEFLSQMKEDIPCVFSWVSDSQSLIKSKPDIRLLTQPKTKEKIFAEISPEQKVQVATATDKEIENLMSVRNSTTIYSQEEIDNLKTGGIITLKGYPFNDVPARIIHINHKTQKVRVELLITELMKEVTVSFENVFYTIYQGGYDVEGGREESLDEIRKQGKNRLDKLLNKQNNYIDPNYE